MPGQRSAIAAVYAVGAVGAFLQIAGANWDVSSHILGIVDTFFTPPHSVLYAGILLVLLSGVAGSLLSRRASVDERRLFAGARVALVGGFVQLVAGPVDFWWHETYGFDPFLFTPAHSILIVGLVLGSAGMVIGVARLAALSGGRSNEPLVILSFASLWLSFNFVVLWLVNAQGVAYTFRICSPEAIYSRNCAFIDSYETATFLPALFLEAFGGATLIFALKRALSWRGALTLIGGIVIVVNATANLGYMAFMLLYAGAPGGHSTSQTRPRPRARKSPRLSHYMLRFSSR